MPPVAGPAATAPPSPRDTRARAVLVVASLLSVAYGVEALVDLARPKLEGFSQPALGVLGPLAPDGVKATFWCYLVSLGAAGVAAAAGLAATASAPDPAERARRTRISQLWLAAILLFPFTMFPLFLIKDHLDTFLVCVPTTAFALWVVTRMQRYRRMPARLVFAVFGWGLLVGSGFGSSMNIWLTDYYLNYAGISANVLETTHNMTSWVVLSAGVFEELGKGAGIAIAYLLCRRYVDNVVSGIVLGAAAGLGFNLIESVEYMSAAGGRNASMQYFSRQSLGLFGAHVAFTAVVGAAFGIARQLREPRRRRLVIACGFTLAAAGHFANDVLLRFYGEVKHNWFAPSPTMDVLVLQPALFVILQGPFVLLYLLLLRAGLREQREALAPALAFEVGTGSEAVTAEEIGVLLSPARRYYLTMQGLLTYGLIGYLTLARLFAAQLDLGMHHWQVSRRDLDPAAPDAVELRLQVLRRRIELARLGDQPLPAPLATLA
jgi:RsiW-degrading membrane proteinase PrsW (M82 family)